MAVTSSYNILINFRATGKFTISLCLNLARISLFHSEIERNSTRARRQKTVATEVLLMTVIGTTRLSKAYHSFLRLINVPFCA